QLCRVWSAVKFLDPQLMTREIDWDGPLVRAIPAARAATTADDSAAAIAGMLHELGDPATRIVQVTKQYAKPQLFSWDGDVLIVNIGPYADVVNENADLLSARSEIV